MVTYAETFFRHPIRVLAPLVAVLLIAITYALLQPATYQSRTALWFETRSTATVAVAPQSSSDPADASHAAGVLKELLTTQAFASAVGHAGPLAAYLAAHGTAATPVQRVLRAVRIADAPAPLSAAQVDDAVGQSMARDVTVTDTGPHVLTITVNGPTPDVARGTAAAVVAQFSDVILGARRTELQTAIDFYAVRADDAARGVKDAQSRLTQYIATFPAAVRASLATQDAQAVALRDAVDSAVTQQHDMVDQLSAAQLTLAHVTDAQLVRQLDAPVAGAPVGAAKRMAYAGIAGLIVGLLISFAVLAATVRSRGSIWRAADLATAIATDATVVGHVREVPGPRRRLPNLLRPRKT